MKTIRMPVDYSERRNTTYYRDFTIVEKTPEAGDGYIREIGSLCGEIVSINEACLDMSANTRDEIMDFDFFEIKVKLDGYEEEEETEIYYVAVKKRV